MPNLLRPGPLVQRAAVLGLLLPAGCGWSAWDQHLLWSPDGSRAVVLVDGLRLTDRTGRLSEVLLPEVYAASWFPDSTRLAVVMKRTVSRFTEVEHAIGPVRAAAVVEEAECLWWVARAPEALRKSERLFYAPRYSDASVLYIRDKYYDQLLQLYPEEKASYEEATATLHSIAVVRVHGDGVETEHTLGLELQNVPEIRVSPQGRFAAFVTRSEGLLVDTTIDTWVVPTDGAAPPARVASGTGRYPGWRADERAVLYFQGPDSRADEQIGCLKSRGVVNASGAFDVADDQATCVAELAFDSDSHVRALPDGRLLFAAPRLSYPSMPPDGLVSVPRRLFVLEDRPSSRGIREVTTDALFTSRAVDYFDVSPDGERVLIGNANGQVSVVSVRDGRHEALPLGLEKPQGYVRGDLPLAIWSGPDAITYVKRVGERPEFILRRGNAELVLSRDWPDAIVRPLMNLPPRTTSPTPAAR